MSESNRHWQVVTLWAAINELSKWPTLTHVLSCFSMPGWNPILHERLRSWWAKSSIPWAWCLSATSRSQSCCIARFFLTINSAQHHIIHNNRLINSYIVHINDTKCSLELTLSLGCKLLQFLLYVADHFSFLQHMAHARNQQMTQCRENDALDYIVLILGAIRLDYVTITYI